MVLMWEPSYGDPYVEWNEVNDHADDGDEGDMEDAAVNVCATPGELILRDGENIQTASCGHWWQVPTVMVGETPLKWAPLAHCRACELDQLALDCIVAIRATLKSTADITEAIPSAVGIALMSIQSLVETAALELLDEHHDSHTRAVATLTMWEEGTTNPQTDHLALCRKAPGCPLPVGHRGGCGEPHYDYDGHVVVVLSHGQRAYEAYADARDWTAHNGERLLKWEETPITIREAWHLAALVART